MAKIIVLGDACVDMLIRLPDRQAEKLDLTKSEPQTQGGGTAANSAVALSRLGSEVHMISVVGDDGYGRWIIQDLQSEKINTDSVHMVYDAFTSMVMALIEPDGERLVVVWPPDGGSQNQIEKKHFDSTLLSDKNWLHTTGMCLRASPSRESILYGMQQAREAGLTVSIDLNMRLELWGLDATTRSIFLKAVELADFVFGNAEEEIIPLSGKNTLEEAVRELGDNKRAIIARMGTKGTFISSPKFNTQIKTFEVEEVVDTLGAGDAFNSGFISAILAGHDLHEAGRWGNAVAALKVTKTGARSTPTRKELDQFLNNL
ncbi:MAG: carbohydrate kinase family protein [Anaerolineaceae bacterium]|nr:carbohydrate kinase family protein [Anaerolineaceae bacterium]